MKTRPDMDKIARGLGAERRGKVAASGGGYFGALQLLADVETRFRVPSGGGRPTDASWTERRLVPLTPQTLKRLEDIAAKVAGASLQSPAMIVIGAVVSLQPSLAWVQEVAPMISRARAV